MIPMMLCSVGVNASNNDDKQYESLNETIEYNILSRKDVMFKIKNYDNQYCILHNRFSNHNESDLLFNCDDSYPLTFSLSNKSGRSGWYDLVQTVDWWTYQDCVFQWDSVRGYNRFNDSVIGSNEHNAKLDCNGEAADPIKIDIVDINKDTVSVKIHSDSGALEWGSAKFENSFMPAKFDSNSDGDIIELFFKDKKIHELINGGESMASGVDYDSCINNSFAEYNICYLQVENKNDLIQCSNKRQINDYDCKVKFK